MKEKIKAVIPFFKRVFQEFSNDNVIKFSAALSYYTVFAIPPLLILIISLCGYFFGAEAVEGLLFGQLRDLVGDSAAMQIQEAIKNVKLSGNSTFATIVSFVTLLFTASGVFAEIQSSINFIWGFKAKPKKGIIRFVVNRLLSFSMIGAMGFILMVSLVLGSILDVISDRLFKVFADDTVYILFVLNNAIVLVLITIIFCIVFKTLPDGKIKWKETIVGAAFTAVLFLLGKYLIGLYLGKNSSIGVYGAAGSLVVILVWVYYSAIILYFGAEFTKVYAEMYGRKIAPNDFSVVIEKVVYEIDEGEVTDVQHSKGEM